MVAYSKAVTSWPFLENIEKDRKTIDWGLISLDYLLLLFQSKVDFDWLRDQHVHQVRTEVVVVDGSSF